MPTKIDTARKTPPVERAATDERVEVRTLAEWRDWLAANHARRTSIWLVSWKASHPRFHVPMTQLVDEALCWGWIDSIPRALDDDRSMRRMSPRRPASAWSRVNKARAEALIAAGRMQPPGMAVIERAKKEGRWIALDTVETLVVPPDLQRELEARPPGLTHFDAFPPSSKRAILEWIASAKAAATRSARVVKTAEMAARNLRANHARQVKSAMPSARG